MVNTNVAEAVLVVGAGQAGAQAVASLWPSPVHS